MQQSPLGAVPADKPYHLNQYVGGTPTSNCASPRSLFRRGSASCHVGGGRQWQQQCRIASGPCAVRRPRLFVHHDDVCVHCVRARAPPQPNRTPFSAWHGCTPKPPSSTRHLVLALFNKGTVACTFEASAGDAAHVVHHLIHSVLRQLAVVGQNV